MGRVKKSVSVLFIFFISKFCFSEKLDIELNISEKKELTLISASQINLSKRGIVLLSHIKDNEWRMVGHRKGFVVLSYWNQEENKENQIFINVKPRDSAVKKEIQVSSFCSIQGITCLNDPYRIKGETTSWKSFYFLKKWCQEEKECLFDLLLSKEAQENLINSLKRSFFVGSCRVGSFGLESCFVSCHGSETVSSHRKKNLKLILKNEGILTHTTILCKKAVKPKKFLVEAKVLLSSQNFANEFGFSKDFAQELMKKNFTLGSSILKMINFDENQFFFEIVGSPIIKVMEGSRSLSKTGGELSVVNKSFSPKNYGNTVNWKSYGLELDVLVSSYKKSQVRLSYELKVSNPSEEKTRISLQGIKIKGDLYLVLGESELVASTNYLRKKEQKKENFFFSKIPIVGPIFKFKKEEKIISKMLLYFRVKELI